MIQKQFAERLTGIVRNGQLDLVIGGLRITHLLFFFFLTATILASCHPKVSSPAEEMIQKFMTQGQVPGVFVAVVKEDSVLYKGSFGFAAIENSKKMTDSTCMELGSVSKAFAGETIYDLYAAGLLDIHDPITKYLPDAPHAWSNITIRHLLTHTSGIKNYLLDPMFKAANYFTGSTDQAFEKFLSTVSIDSMLRMFYTLPIEFVPGQTWSYSNTGYILLGKIAEQASGKPFFELVNKRVLAPTGLKQTKANELAAQEGCLAKGYIVKEGKQLASRVLTSNYAFSAGAWATSGKEMIQYLKAIHKKMLPSDKHGYDWRTFSGNTDLPFYYNAGRFYSTYHGMKIIAHNGGTPGFSSSWLYVADKNISIIVLINRQDYAPIDALAWDILSLYEPSLKYPDKKLDGDEETSYAKKLLNIIHAIKKDTAYPADIAEPLKLFLQTDNGKGLWHWYFERGFPGEAYCVDKESVGAYKAFRFILPYAKDVQYRLTILVNPKNKISQIRWW